MSQPDYLCFYHGTTKKNAFGLMRDGLSSGYLTQCESQASYYAGEACEAAKESGSLNEEPAILVIKVPVSHLQADSRSVDEPLTFVLDKHGLSEDDFFEALENDGFGWPEGPSDWQRSLFLVDSVRFQGDGTCRGEVVYDLQNPVGFDDFEIDYPSLNTIEF